MLAGWKKLRTTYLSHVDKWRAAGQLRGRADSVGTQMKLMTERDVGAATDLLQNLGADN
jgi:hypothetical protein